MCGITGFVSYEYDQSHLKNMTDSIQHRGPDADGYFFDPDKGVGLGHRRLSILDLSSAANQPMTSHCGRYTMVFNGEVYNYREVAKKLHRDWKTQSDTEVVLEAFTEFGNKFIKHLNGMFAIAIWDKEKKELSLFRDRLGIKPLLYFFDGVHFAFASEMKALLALNIKKELNKDAIKDYLFLEYIPQEKSVFKNVFKLKPGHYLTYSEQKGMRIQEYYDLLGKVTERKKSSEEDVVDGLKEKLKKSIALRKISDVPIGAFLSGGTDSSLICSIFQEINTLPVTTFNIGFDVADYDESDYAKKVAAHLKTDHQYYLVTDKEAKLGIENIVDFYDEPFAVPSVIPTMILSAKTKQRASVALSGDGGDELFMGYGYYNWQQRIEKLHKYGGKTGVKMASTLLKFTNNRGKRVSRVMDISDFNRSWIHIWSQEQYMFTEREIAKLFGEVTYRHQSTNSNWDKINAMELHPFEKISLFDIQNYLAQDLLHKVDIASMSTGLELRVPFLDHELVEYAINLPLEYKVNRGEQKYVLKKLLSKYLPDDLVYRKKWGFPAPIGNWLQNDLSYLIEKYLNQQMTAKIGLFDGKYVDKLVEEFKAGKHFHFKRIWALIAFNMWYEKWM